MMGLVNVLVHAGMMLQAMDPVDGEIIESHVCDGREHQPGPAMVAHVGVKQAFATDLGQEERQGEKVDDGKRPEGRFDLLADLIPQETRMVLEPSVKDEVI